MKASNTQLDSQLEMLMTSRACWTFFCIFCSIRGAVSDLSEFSDSVRQRILVSKDTSFTLYLKPIRSCQISFSYFIGESGSGVSLKCELSSSKNEILKDSAEACEERIEHSFVLESKEYKLSLANSSPEESEISLFVKARDCFRLRESLLKKDLEKVAEKFERLFDRQLKVLENNLESKLYSRKKVQIALENLHDKVWLASTTEVLFLLVLGFFQLKLLKNALQRKELI